MPKKTLIDVKGLSDAKVDKMLEAACKLLPAVQAGGFVTAGEWIVMVRAPKTFFPFSDTATPTFCDLQSSRSSRDTHAPPSASVSFVLPARPPRQRKDNINIKTGADTLDAILGGGVPTRNLTEIFGEWRCVHAPSPPHAYSRSQKAQLCTAVCPFFFLGLEISFY